VTWRGKGLAVVGAALSLGVAPRQAAAAGFDTPILYTARHQAMGGTAIASVDDASAGFHNPAGLQGIRGLGLIGDFSLILGKVKATPDADFSGNIESERVLAPFFLLGAGYRLHEWVSLGLAGFPVASGGAEYKYRAGATEWIDSTEIVFFETTPMVSLNVPADEWLPGKLAIGAGYRFSYVTFERLKGPEENPVFLDLGLQGINATGFRVGAQYQPNDWLKLGVVFRNKIVVTTKADSITVATQEGTDASLDFTLPAKLGFGARVDFDRVGLATDIEWALQSQNEHPPLKGTLGGEQQEVANVFDWKNGVTWRLGAEYRLGDAPTFPLRLGYIYDTRVTHELYPSAFGTPPAPTHTVTGGAGFVQEHWQVNVALSHRTGSTHVAETDPEGRCEFCGFPGDYSIEMTGLYVDASVDLPL
jgi:long-subunit fatty acid transport protein